MDLRPARLLTFTASILLTVSFLFAIAPAAADEDGGNHGTIKVHDELTASPANRNEPHVDCEDFWVEGFNMAAESGTLSFYSWPPTGTKELVMVANWTGTWEDDGKGTHFLAGPFVLAPGHYRVEATNAMTGGDRGDHEDDDPTDGKVHTKKKMLWVEPCEDAENPPDELACPTDLTAAVNSDGSITLNWIPAPGSQGTNVYKLVSDSDFEYVATLPPDVTQYTDTNVQPNTDYAYTVTALYEGDEVQESTDCAWVEVTTIPEFPTVAAMTVALLGGTLAYVGATRRR